MSVKSDAEQFEAQRDREQAIRKRLDDLSATEKTTENTTGDPDLLIPLVRQPTPGSDGEGYVDAEGNIHTPLVGTKGFHVNRPGTPEPAWMKNGRQVRPMTSRERQQEEDERLDKDALAKLAHYQTLVQKDLDLTEAMEADRVKRMKKEARTGTRPMPTRRDSISLAEAQRRGYIGQGSDSNYRDQAGVPVNLYDNRRGDPSSFGGGL